MVKDQTGKIIKVYVDDMLVKSSIVADHVRHLDEIFKILRKYQMRLNSNKCTFRVTLGKFLGYLVHNRGIDANAVKVWWKNLLP